jgi:hypothetical protein
MLVLLQIKGIYIYSVIGEGDVLHYGTAGLYCEEVLLEVKMSCSCEEFVDNSLTYSSPYFFMKLCGCMYVNI